VLDFTSALYLGLRHPSRSLRAWSALTTGKPAALCSPASSEWISGQLATLQGCERATLVPSTLHLFWDLFEVLGREQMRIYMDDGTYAIGRWGVERAAARGVPVRHFRHHDVSAVRVLIERDGRSGDRPLVVVDGFCPTCGNPAPIPQLLQCVEPHGGRVVIDDTQALGVLGKRSVAAAPYGQGGGGSLPWHGLRSPQMIVGSSLAKSFGVPIAVLAGSERVVRRFEERSETRVHSSPPSLAALRAAESALNLNRVQGDRCRLYLAQLVERFRAGLRQIGLTAAGGLFPVQMLALDSLQARTLHLRLLGLGIKTVLVRCCRGIGLRLGFLFTVLHRPADIDRVLEALDRLMVSDRAVRLPVMAS
jgi:8-amino-7-oxononanoate synthase